MSQEENNNKKHQQKGIEKSNTKRVNREKEIIYKAYPVDDENKAFSETKLSYLNKDELPTIRQISEKRRYWFVRTFGGKLFDYYYETNKVGILGNDVPMEYIHNAKQNDATFSTLQNYVFKNIYPDNLGESTKLSNQLVDFYHNIKIDDIVLMPSENSDFIAFGKITSNIQENVSLIPQRFIHRDKEYVYPSKTRKVEWLKIMKKHEVVGDLRNLLASQMGITNADKYGEFIESNLSTFFENDENFYSTLCIDLNEDEELNVFELQRYLEALTILYSDFCLQNNIPYNEDLFLKIKVQSPGNLIYKMGKAIEAIPSKTGRVATKALLGATGLMVAGFAGLIILSVTGSDPNLEVEKKADGSFNLKAGIKGNLFENISNAKDRAQARKTKDSKDSLEIEAIKFNQYLDRKKHGALTKEDRKKYENQLIDSAQALNITTIESKAVNYKNVD